MEELWEKIKPIGKLILIIVVIIYLWQSGILESLYDSVMKMSL